MSAQLIMEDVMALALILLVVELAHVVLVMHSRPMDTNAAVDLYYYIIIIISDL